MSSSTKDRILDAAECLFAQHGFEGTSLRAVTSEADVNLASVNYHFGNKIGLFQAIFERRVGHINDARLEQLDRLQSRGLPPSLEELLEAFVGPALRLTSREGEGFESFMRLVGRMSTVSGQHAEVIRDVFRDVQERFFPAFMQALPHLSAPEVFWRLHFLIGSMCSYLADPCRLELISQGHCRSDDPEESLRQLVAFAAGALRGPSALPHPTTPASKESHP